MSKNLTKTQKDALKLLEQRGSIPVQGLHGNTVKVYQDLRRRNLVKFVDGVFHYVVPPTPEQIEKHLIDNFGKLTLKQIAFDLCLAQSTLCRIKKKLNLPALRRGGARRGPDPRTAAQTINRRPADHSNPTVDDHINRIMAMSI